MNNAKNVIIFFLILLFVVSAVESEAKSYAYLIGTDGKAVKIDAETDTILATQNLLDAGSYVQNGETSVVADPVNKHLFVVTGRKSSKILVYDIKTLTLIKDLGIYTSEPDITIFLTPDGKKIFVIWWNTKLEGGAWQFDVFDGVTLEKIKTLDFYFYPKQVTFSKDSSTLYAIEGGDEAKIKVIDTSKLMYVSTLDLNTIWKTDVFAQGVEDQRSEKILVSETEKVLITDQPKDTLFVYDLKNKTASPRISTGISGDEKLSGDGMKVYINEKQNVWSVDKTYILYQKSMGKIYSYDVATGKKNGTVQFTVDRESNIIGIHPGNNKVYVVGEIQGVKSLIIVDIFNFKVLKTLKIPKNSLFMVFYNE